MTKTSNMFYRKQLKWVRLFAFFVIRLYRGRMTKKADLFGSFTQGCGCCAALPWAIIFRPYGALK